MNDVVSKWGTIYPEKFKPEEEIFNTIKRGNRLFISTGCGAPQYLINALVKFVESHPKAFTDTEVFQVWTLGVSVYTEEKFTYNFRHNSFFLSYKSRDSINRGLADYTPVFLSRVPDLLHRKQIDFNVALIQTSLPDSNGFVSLGISVDICKAAVENADCIIAQMNANMPRVHGDTFININKIDYLVRHDEPLLRYTPTVSSDIARQAGKYVAKIINDGDTIQIGYGSLPNAVLENLKGKKHLGIHTELLSDAVIDLIQAGVIDNSRKNIDRGKTVASFCMGTAKTYNYINDNPEMEFRTIEYTNNPLVISRIKNMTAINSALQIDLTGQVSVESVDGKFFSGIGGSADFMRGAPLAPGGKTILVMQSTAKNGTVSRIVPSLSAGTGVTLNRGDVFYVVTEYGIAYIHGKNIRERAMDLISIAHPKFREQLIRDAKKLSLIYHDQAYLPGKAGQYPEHLEEYRESGKGLPLLFRPVRINDESLIKDFLYALSDKSLRNRFFSSRKDLPHKIRQNFVVIDYTKEMVVLAILKTDSTEKVIGIGQFSKETKSLYAEIACAVRDEFQGQGIGTELLKYLSMQARKEGLHGFTADVLAENRAMLNIFKKMRFSIQRHIEDGIYRMVMDFN